QRPAFRLLLAALLLLLWLVVAEPEEPLRQDGRMIAHDQNGKGGGKDQAAEHGADYACLCGRNEGTVTADAGSLFSAGQLLIGIQRHEAVGHLALALLILRISRRGGRPEPSVGLAIEVAELDQRRLD